MHSNSTSSTSSLLPTDQTVAESMNRKPNESTIQSLARWTSSKCFGIYDERQFSNIQRLTDVIFLALLEKKRPNDVRGGNFHKAFAKPSVSTRQEHRVKILLHRQGLWWCCRCHQSMLMVVSLTKLRPGKFRSQVKDTSSR